MKLSLCLAVYNEIDFIHYPLESSYDLVDEIIIIDGGSDDGTVEKAKSYGEKVKVIVTDNPPMFHINKQKAIEQASGVWILLLDADEALSPELREELKSIINKKDSIASLQNDNKVAYWIPRRNFFLTKFLKKGGIYPDYTIRLFKRGVAKFADWKSVEDVHKNVEIEGEIGHLKKDILHYADADFSRYLSRWNRYTSMDADLLIKNNEKVCFPCYFIGKPLYTFFNIYLRHKGFTDGFPGFVWALFSAIRYWVIYVKVWQKQK